MGIIPLFFSLQSISECLAHGALALYVLYSYKKCNVYDAHYTGASIYIMCSDFSVDKVLKIAYSYFYFYFLVLLALLVMALFTLGSCYTITDNIVVAGSSIICSFVFLILFYTATNGAMDMFSLLIKASAFFVFEMAIVAMIVLSQNL
ncbi:uncharacterized protein NEMAJ01_0451 [Nematocida major]|uniref:uncharacterized protein n=1 Tax=Nematocida major TaxID=1912982 RepID=UPI00200810EE|nr:uncharacterized protein NEMAJ01_0451 [Nematocida major]KAH9385555.1 hypothetical protein NEMAJ01_0451 [Nematocida major]